MNLPAAVSSCFSKYAIFDGRASRPEYWYFQLFVYVVLAVIVVLVSIVPDMATIVGIAGCVFYLFVPFGAIDVLIWLCQEGVEGDNRFGPDPLAVQ